MSYSFTVTAKTKDEAKEKAIAEMETVVSGQFTHKTDADAVLVAVHSFIDILGEPHEGDNVVVSVNGSLSQNAPGDYTAAGVSISASLRNA